MIVVSQQQPGTSGLGNIPGPSPTSYAPNYGATVAAAQRSAGSWTQVSPISGRRLGAEAENGGTFGSIPQWVWWGGGGLLVGAVAGALIWGGKRRK